jgi:hypothetical protein
MNWKTARAILRGAAGMQISGSGLHLHCCRRTSGGAVRPRRAGLTVGCEALETAGIAPDDIAIVFALQR